MDIPSEYVSDLLDPDLSSEDRRSRYQITKYMDKKWRTSAFVREHLAVMRQASLDAAKAVLEDAAVEAALNLVTLSNPRNGETARKACNDILTASGVLEIELEEPQSEKGKDVVMRLIRGRQRAEEKGEEPSESSAGSSSS